MKIKMPHLELHQQEVFERVRYAKGTGETFVVKSPRQCGKTYFLKFVLLYYALMFPGSKSILLEPVGYQARRVQRELNKDLRHKKLIESSNLTDGYITFNNGSEIHFKSAEQGENLRGMTATGIFVIDEAAYITDTVYEITLPFTNVARAPKLIVSTPLFKDGFFYNEFTDPLNSIFDWSRDRYDFSLFLSPEDMERYRKKYTRQKFLSEIMGQFIDALSEVFGNFRACVCTPEDMKPVYGGLDWGAGANNDSTCLTLMNKNKQVVYKWSTADQDPVSQVASIASIINSFPSLKAVYVEKNSIGNVYLSMLRKQVNNVALIRAFDTTNERKREIIENLIVAFEQRLIGIDNDPILWAQLAGFQMKKLAHGYTYGNDKDSTHDDRVLSLAFCYAMFNDKPSGTIGFSKK
ncbi:MAG: terminase family protein [Bacteroidales bacterium]|nr:terminase family protein [Bacteroidales bacterium]